jgi:predicted CXXCH cytochrome family protein
MFDGTERRFASTAFRPVIDHGGAAFDLPVEGNAEPKRYSAPLALGRGHIVQYLVAGREGRWQALPFGIDVARGEWFDIFPEAPQPRDWEHWTQPGMTANAQCLSCHTTGYVRGYAIEGDRYATRWAEGGVGCEACHGPGQQHVQELEKSDRHPRYPLEGHTALTSGRDTLTACAPCHSRRLEIRDGFVPGAELQDYFDAPELLETDMYYPDGRVRGEAFEWWSFQMSHMAERGVTCLDCHEPHSGKLRAEGDGLCLRCHVGALASASHTHHPPGSSGARCVACHMSLTVFMERDRRHDHSFQRPDPEGAARLGAPDPCASCHEDKPVGWSSKLVAQWYGPTPATLAQREVALIIESGRRGDDTRVEDMIALMSGGTDVVRRTSIARLLASWGGREDVQHALKLAASQDPEPLARAAAVQALGDVPELPTTVQDICRLATKDARRLVRIEAGFSLRQSPSSSMSSTDGSAVRRAFEEWEQAQDLRADLPETNYNRGVFLAGREDTAGAEAAYRAALARWADYAPAREALAALLADAGRPIEAERELRALVARSPEQAKPHCLLGLHLGRYASWPDGASELEECLARDPDAPRARYNLGLLYAKTGDLDRATGVLEEAIRDPESRSDALRALVRLGSANDDGALVDKWLQEALLADPDLRNEPTVARALQDRGSR